MKKILFVILSVGIILLSSCVKPAPAPEPDPEQAPLAIAAAVMKGPTGVGAAYLMEHTQQGQNSYTFALADTPEQVVAMLINGSVDVAALPTNLAANLYAKTEGQLQMAAITTSGMLYVLEAGDTVHSWEDLRGRTVYATGRGANPEYMLDYLLRANGLTPEEDVFVEFLSEHAELATLLASGQAELGLLPEPFVTSAMMQNAQLRLAFDLNEEWQKAASDGQMAMTCLVARREFAEAQPRALAQFLTDMEQSIQFAVDNVAEAAALCEQHGVIPKAAVAERAIPRCNLTFISGAAMQEAISAYFELLYQANPQSVGGAVPDEDFYYIP